MKKKSERGKAGHEVWHEGFGDALNNYGDHRSDYSDRHLRKCYGNGYTEGQVNRAVQKKYKTL